MAAARRRKSRIEPRSWQATIASRAAVGYTMGSMAPHAAMSPAEYAARVRDEMKLRGCRGARVVTSPHGTVLQFEDGQGRTHIRPVGRPDASSDPADAARMLLAEIAERGPTLY